jgi:hypothetical protein
MSLGDHTKGSDSAVLPTSADHNHTRRKRKVQEVGGNGRIEGRMGGEKNKIKKE